MTYYDILDVLPTASDEEIRRAYRVLVEIHHPDRMQALRADVQQRASARLQAINEAYAVLRDPQERARYDAALAQQPAGEAVAFAPRGNPGVARSRTQARIREVEQRIREAETHAASLRPQLSGRQRLDQRWERYLFVSLALVWPYLFFGLWTALRLGNAPTEWPAPQALVLLTLFGYTIEGAALAVSRTPWRAAGAPRLLLLAPLVVLALAATVLLASPRTLQLTVLLLGYAALVWQSAGSPLAAQRDHVLVAQSTLQRLESDLTTYHAELRRLRTDLARQ